MMRDFTTTVYRQLLEEALHAGYALMPLVEYIATGKQGTRVMILRHDVDRRPHCALRIAEMQHGMGVKGTYYFRIVRSSFAPHIISKIAHLGHEIGYHYEDLATCKGNSEKAIEQFLENLETLRGFYPVETICMHGSPLSKWDNRLLWAKYDYRDYGIVAEPYCDMDFDDTLYLTDTGRRWDGKKVSVRDSVESSFTQSFHSTSDIVTAFRSGSLPSHVMQNVHPHRWSENHVEWLAELGGQNAKNLVKRLLIRSRAWLEPGVTR